MLNLENWHRWIYLQSRNRDTDIENKYMDTKRGTGCVGWIWRLGLTHIVVVVQLLSHVQLVVTPWTAACQAPLSFTVSWNLLKFMSIESVMPSNHLILCPLLLLSSVFPSIRVFSNELALPIKLSKYCSFSISSSNLGLIWNPVNSKSIGWFDLLAVQGTLKSLLQHLSSKTSVPRQSAFFMVQL